MSLKAVEMTGVSFHYDGVDGSKIRALHDINLELEYGEKVAVLGANGSGKTTLFYHLNGLLLPQSGEITVQGTEVNKKNRKELIKNVGIVFENPDNQLFSTTVYDDVAFAYRNQNFSEKEIKNKVPALLDKVQAGDLAEKSPYNLSWGQKKRVAIAATLAMDPDILIFDEPFSGLDPLVSKYLMALLEDLHEEGKTILMGTHNVDIAHSWADKIIILYEGEVFAAGPVDLLEDKKMMEKVHLDTPLLAKIFEGSSYTPRSVTEARQLINNLSFNPVDQDT